MSRILSSPAVPPVFFPPPRRREGGQQNNQNLFALLSLMNQQQNREEDRSFRQDIAERQLKLAEDASQDRNVDRSFRQMEQRLVSTQKALTKTGEKAKEDHLKSNFFDPYDASFKKQNSIVDPFIQQLTRTKNVNQRLAVQKGRRLLHNLDVSLGEQFNRGGSNSHGAVSGTHNALQRLAFRVPGIIETDEFRELDAKLQSPEVSKKNIPPSEFRQFALNSDEFRPIRDSINDQVEAEQRKITDPFVNVDPNPASIRALNKTFREVQLNFHPDAFAPPPATPTSAPEPFRFSPGLSLKISSSLSRPSTSAERITERTAALEDRAVRGSLELGEDPSAISAITSGVGGKIDVATTGAANLVDRVLGVSEADARSFFTSPFGTVGSVREGGPPGIIPPGSSVGVGPRSGETAPPGFFNQSLGGVAPPNPGLLSSLAQLFGGRSPFSLRQGGQPLETTLQDISVQSDSRTQRGTPPLRIEEGPFPAAPSGEGDFLEQFLRQAQGSFASPEQDEVEKLFSLIGPQ